MKFRRYITLSLLFTTITIPGFANNLRLDSLRTEAIVLNKNTFIDTSSINKLNKLAANYFELNQDSTLYYGQKSIAKARKINYKAGIANGLVQTGHVKFFKGDFFQAERDFNEAISIYKYLKDIRGLSSCYTLYGRMYNLLADYASALRYLNMAARINKQLKSPLDEADSYKNIGIVYFSEGKYSTSLDYYYKALLIGVKEHNKVISAAAYNDIGFVLYNMELYPKALEYYTRALDMFKDTNDLLGVGIANENIGEVYLAQNNDDRAISYLTKSIKIAENQEDKDGMSSVYTDMGLCYARKKDFEKSIGYLKTSLQIATKYKIVYNRAYALIGFAEVYNLKKDYKNAYKYAVEGQVLAVKLGNLRIRSNAALQLNKTLAGLGKFEEAYKYLRQYISLNDSLNNNESIQKLTSYNLELDFAAKRQVLTARQVENDLLYSQKIKQQRLINAIFLCITLSTLAISVVYYGQKRKQQKINFLLGEKNKLVYQQKANLDEQADKLNDLNSLKDRLISVLAHDLRAPLSTLRGLFSLLQDDTISHGQLLDMIPGVLKKLEYTSDFLDTLLFWVNSQMDNFDSSAKNFHFKDIVSFETENYNEQAALKGIRLIDKVTGDVILSADPNSIRIVIRNLITNAIKFCKHNDTIEISAYRQDDDCYVIRVTDTGIGMLPDQLNKLFKSKVNSKIGTNNESGTGMGMLFCKDLIEKCSGKIWVTSEPGKGTEFSFSIPAGVFKNEKVELV